MSRNRMAENDAELAVLRRRATGEMSPEFEADLAKMRRYNAPADTLVRVFVSPYGQSILICCYAIEAEDGVAGAYGVGPWTNEGWRMTDGERWWVISNPFVWSSPGSASRRTKFNITPCDPPPARE